jgi:hypothetical protein
MSTLLCHPHCRSGHGTKTLDLVLLNLLLFSFVGSASLKHLKSFNKHNPVPNLWFEASPEHFLCFSLEKKDRGYRLIEDHHVGSLFRNDFRCWPMRGNRRRDETDSLALTHSHIARKPIPPHEDIPDIPHVVDRISF